MKIKCIILDDEPLAAEVIQSHLKEFPNMEVLGVFTNPVDALDTIKNKEVDVIFLDINMPKMNGLEFIKNSGIQSQFIVTTAYREFAVESFDLEVLDYLVKPIPFSRFLKSINKLTQKIDKETNNDIQNNQKEKSFIFFKVDKKLIKVKFDDIYYLESLKDYIKVFTKTGNHLVHKSLSSATEELPNKQFLRIHRSFTVALHEIEAIEGNSVLVNGQRIPIGRKYINHAKEIILNNSH